jgi:hypothetical protein
LCCRPGAGWWRIATYNTPIQTNVSYPVKRLVCVNYKRVTGKCLGPLAEPSRPQEKERRRGWLATPACPRVRSWGTMSVQRRCPRPPRLGPRQGGGRERGVSRWAARPRVPPVPAGPRAPGRRRQLPTSGSHRS